MCRAVSRPDRGSRTLTSSGLSCSPCDGPRPWSDVARGADPPRRRQVWRVWRPVRTGDSDERARGAGRHVARGQGRPPVPARAGRPPARLHRPTEAIRDWVTNVRTTHYIIGSVVGPHPYPEMVRDLQRVIGDEAREQYLSLDGKLPDVVVACVGGGSNAIGIFTAFLDDRDVALVGVEAAGRGVKTGEHAASLVGGRPGVLHGTYSYVLQDGDGQILPTHSISAGLDYPGVGPEHAFLHETERVEYVAVTDKDALAALEIGIPHSDPLADGSVIQHAGQVALEHGMTVSGALGVAQAVAAEGVPVVLMTYINPVLSYDPRRFAAEVSQAGVAGVIVPDLPIEE